MPLAVPALKRIAIYQMRCYIPAVLYMMRKHNAYANYLYHRETLSGAYWGHPAERAAIVEGAVPRYRNHSFGGRRRRRRSRVERVRAAHREFLMVGRRWDIDIREPLAFDGPECAADLRTLAQRHGRKRTAEWIDYFAFTRGLYGPDIPPFVLRVFWDNWLVWKALDSGKPVIDASTAVLAVHQNHDYSHHPEGKQGVWYGEEAGRNAQLAGGWRHLRTIADATERLTPTELKPNALRHWCKVKRYLRQSGRVLWNDVWHPVWFAFLNLTRPSRRSFHH